MTFIKMQRVFGIFAITGGSFIAFIQLWLHFDPYSFIAAYFHLLGLLAISIGLIGLYLHQYKEIGEFGLFSFILSSIGLSLWSGYHWFQTFVFPNLLKSVANIMEIPLPSMDYGKSLALYTWALGLLFFAGISIWKGTFSRWKIAFLLLSPCFIFIPYGIIITYFLAGLGFIFCGITLYEYEGTEFNEKDENEETADRDEKKLEANQ